MKDKLSTLKQEAIDKIIEVNSKDDLNQVKIKYLGKKGDLTSILKALSSVTPEERAEIGKLANLAKQELEKLIEDKSKSLDNAVFEQLKDTEWIDISAPGEKVNT